jgi:hypothetical protein
MSHLNLHEDQTTKDHKRPQINRVLITNNKGKWTDQALKEAMDVIDKGTCSLRVVNKSWNILVASFSNHL